MYHASLPGTSCAHSSPGNPPGPFRRSLRGIVWLAVVCGYCAGAAAAAAPQEQFQFLKLGEVRPSGWLLQQLQTEARDGFATHLDNLTTSAKSRVDLPTFDPRKKTEMEKSWWNGETTGNWMDALIRLAYLSDDPAAKKKSDELVAQILSYQEEDGYLGMYTPDTRYRQPAEGQNGEFWTQACMFRGLLAYYELTGRKDVLDAVERAVKLMISKYGPDRPYWPPRVIRGGPTHNLMFVDVCEWLWRLTGDKSYADFAQFLYDSYNDRQDVFETSMLLKNLSDPAVMYDGHGAHVMEHLRVPLFVAYATRDPKYWPAVDNIFPKTDRHLSAGGACIGDEDIGQRPGGPNIGCEYCTMLELLNSLQSGIQKSGQAGLGDRIEILAYNAGQGSRLRDGKAIQYLTRDNQHSADIAAGRGARFKLSPTHEDVAVCCAPTAVKFYPYLTGGLWMKEKDGSGLVAVAYAPNVVKTKLNGTDVAVETATSYPFEDTIRMTVRTDKPSRFTLRLRVPEWKGEMRVEATGAKEARKNNWCLLSKEWKSGDTVTITFRPEIERNTANDKSGVYWQRGPLVYSLPIASQRKESKKYALEGFADWDYTPADGAFFDYAVDKDTGKFVFEGAAVAAGTNPWEKPPLALSGMLLNRASGKGENVRLVPMGSSLLRHTVFADMESMPKAVAGQADLLKGSTNLARKAEVEAASTAKGYIAKALIDGVAEGFPENQRAEWASEKGREGTKVKLFWEMPEAIESVWFFDRPNDKDRVLAAQVKFSDGSTAEIGELPNDGKAPFRLKIPSKTITWMEVTITKASPATNNVGFSEIAVFEKEPAP